MNAGFLITESAFITKNLDKLENFMKSHDIFGSKIILRSSKKLIYNIK